MNIFNFNLIRLRFAFSYLRLHSKYGQWEPWAKEALGWFLERWSYLLLVEKAGFETSVIMGCVVQITSPKRQVHYEALTGETLPPRSIHLARFARPRGEDNMPQFVRFFLAVFEMATERDVPCVYAVMHRILLFKIDRIFTRLFPDIQKTYPHGFIEVIDAPHFYRDGEHGEEKKYEFIPVKIHRRAFDPYAEKLRHPSSIPKKAARKQ
jgi:hypothetical protein